jgi:hypothetical protein
MLDRTQREGGSSHRRRAGKDLPANFEARVMVFLYV